MSFPPDFALVGAERVEFLWAGRVLPVTLANVERATERLWATMFIVGIGSQTDAQLRIVELADALGRARRRGVDVRVLLADLEVTFEGPSANDVATYYLLQDGVEVRHFVSDRHDTTHSKYLLIDDRIVILGSGNWTPGGLLSNLEAALRVTSETFSRMLRGRFEAEWISAKVPEPLP